MNRVGKINLPYSPRGVQAALLYLHLCTPVHKKPPWQKTYQGGFIFILNPTEISNLYYESKVHFHSMDGHAARQTARSMMTIYYASHAFPLHPRTSTSLWRTNSLMFARAGF